MQNNLTKEEASDLKSLTDRLIECELNLAKAQMIRIEAARQLDNFVHRLQFPEPKVQVRRLPGPTRNSQGALDGTSSKKPIS